MRSIRRRAGWSMVAKKSGSPTATRSTGICSRANHTRTAAGMRSSVRMLWNSSATISIVARSTGVLAACFSACLRWCSSSSSAGVLHRHGRASAGRCGHRHAPLQPASASATAVFSRGDMVEPVAVWPNSGSCRPIRRFSRPSTASAWSGVWRGSAALRVCRRVSSCTRPRPPAPPPVLAPACASEPCPVGAAMPVSRVRRINGRRSTSGSTPCSISQRLVS